MTDYAKMIEDMRVLTFGIIDAPPQQQQRQQPQQPNAYGSGYPSSVRDQFDAPIPFAGKDMYANKVSEKKANTNKAKTNVKATPSRPAPPATLSVPRFNAEQLGNQLEKLRELQSNSGRTSAHTHGKADIAGAKSIFEKKVLDEITSRLKAMRPTATDETDAKASVDLYLAQLSRLAETHNSHLLAATVKTQKLLKQEHVRAYIATSDTLASRIREAEDAANKQGPHA